MSQYDRDKVIAFECPYCGAQPGSSCLSNRGKPAAEEHTPRKTLAYPRFGRSGDGSRKRGVRSGRIELTDDQERILGSVGMMRIKSINLRFEGTKVEDWKGVIECMKLGLVEIFIGEDQGSDRKGEACPRLRFTKKGKRAWDFRSSQ